MDAYDLHEARQVQEYYGVSGADALLKISGAVPAGKVWTVISAALSPSVAETRIVWFAIVTRAGTIMPITVPESIALAPLLQQKFPMLTEGMELKLYQGEKLVAYRAAATAGSSISLEFRYIETDLPYYAYEEPLKKVVKTSLKHGSVYRSTGGISQVSPGGGSPGESSSGGGGGGGGDLPI